MHSFEHRGTDAQSYLLGASPCSYWDVDVLHVAVLPDLLERAAKVKAAIGEFSQVVLCTIVTDPDTVLVVLREPLLTGFGFNSPLLQRAATLAFVAGYNF